MIETDSTKANSITACTLKVGNMEYKAGEFRVGNFYIEGSTLSPKTQIHDQYNRPLFPAGTISSIYSFTEDPTKVECNGNVIFMRAKRIIVQTGGLQITHYDNILDNGDPHVEPTRLCHGTNIQDADGKWLIRAGHWVADMSDEEIEERFGPTTKKED